MYQCGIIVPRPKGVLKAIEILDNYKKNKMRNKFAEVLYNYSKKIVKLES